MVIQKKITKIVLMLLLVSTINFGSDYRDDSIDKLKVKLQIFYKVGSAEEIKKILYELGRKYEYSVDDHESALKYWEEAVKLGSAEAAMEIAGLYTEIKGDIENAKKYYLKAYELGDVKGLFDIGEIYFWLEDFENAKKYLEKAVKEGNEKVKKDAIEYLTEIYNKM